jgi:hypothetical protein
VENSAFALRPALDHFTFIIGTYIAANPRLDRKSIEEVVEYLALEVLETAEEQRPDIHSLLEGSNRRENARRVVRSRDERHHTYDTYIHRKDGTRSLRETSENE